MPAMGVSLVVGLWAALGAVPVAEISGGNALTLPAQRHLVRVVHADGTGSLLLAIQQGGASGHGLGFYRSDDEGLSWRWMAAIQDDSTERDTADVLQLGQDLAVVYSYEGPSLSGSTRHDVYYQRWRYQPATRSFAPDPPLRVFDSTSSSTAFYRAEIAADSAGRLWVLAFRLNADGTHAAAIAVSQDGGQSFTPLPDLASLAHRAGGRLLSLGHGMMFLFGEHQSSEPARFRIRQDSAPLDSWGAIQTAFSDGIYHGAGLSAAVTPGGQVHLLYKSEAEESLWYRLFDGTSFGPRRQVDDASWWSTQGAVTLAGDDVYLFYNRVITADTNYEIRFRRLSGGVLGAPVVLDSTVAFKGYPAALERAPTTMPWAPCVFGFTPDAASGGEAKAVFQPITGGLPPPDGGTPDAGTPDAGAPDAGTPDGGSPPAGTVLFSDDFNRSGSTLGSQWVQDLGLWLTNGQVAASDSSSSDLAHVPSVNCRDCRVEAAVVGFGVPETALVLRAQTSRPTDRYDVAILSSGQLVIRRQLGGVTTTLGQVASGVVLDEWATISLQAVGGSPVSLTATVNGVPKLSVTDTSPGALAQGGYAGMWTTRAGVGYDNFRIISVGTTPTDGGTPDAGAPDAGTPDAGTPDAGTPDAGTPDAGTPDGGTLALTTVLTDTAHEFLAVGTTGTAYSLRLDQSRANLYASTDNARSWSLRKSYTSSFMQMATLQSGVLIADVLSSGVHSLARSADQGSTWKNVLSIGQNRMLTPHSVAELNGEAFFAEYQSYTNNNAPIRLWVSADQGATWTVRYTFTDHRHAHGLRPDPAHGALWILFGDSTAQSGVYRSTDGGRSWTKMLGGQQGDVVDAIVRPDGLLFGQDISFLPNLPHIATLSSSGAYRELARITGPSYSSHGISSGGFLVGAAREPDEDIYPPGEVSAHLYGSADGVSWKDLRQYPRLSAGDNVRADVYWELQTGELVLQLYNAQGFGPNGKGYQLLVPSIR